MAVGYPYGDWMAEIDSRIGRILSAIDDNGLRDNTLVILTSDNGPEATAFVTSRATGRDPNGRLRGIKRDVWEGGTRVPFVVRWPGQIAAPGTVSNELIWQGDIFATVAAYLGADLPGDVAPDGESFLNILRGQSKPSQRRDSIVIASQYDHRAVITIAGWKLIDSTGGGGIATRRTTPPTPTSSTPPEPIEARPSSSSTCPPISGKTRNVIADITDVTAIRSDLVLKAGGDLLARLDQYRTTPTSAVFVPFPDNDLDGMPNWFENRHVGLGRENPSDARWISTATVSPISRSTRTAPTPTSADTDGDGFLDGDEVHTRHTNPTRAGP